MKTKRTIRNQKIQIDSTSLSSGTWRHATIIALCAALLVSVHPLHAQYDPNTDPGCGFRPVVTSDGGVISSVSDEASQVGIDVLDAGGNAMDAAIATAFALCVTRPDFAGLGGSGSLVYRSANGEKAALDFRPPAPKDMKPDSFNDSAYKLGVIGHLKVGVPTTVAAMAAALERYGSGKFNLGQLIRSDDPLHPRAYELARYGATVSFGLAASMFFASPNLIIYPESARTFLVGGVAPYPPGSKFIQLDLSNSLDAIAHEGPSVFYTGWIAQAIDQDMKNAETDLDKNPAFLPVWAEQGLTDPGCHPESGDLGNCHLGSGDRGLMTLDDLAEYKPLWVDPVITTYRGNEIIGMPAPFSGGVFIAEMLNILEGYPLGSNGAVLQGKPRDFRFGRTDYVHVLAEAEKLAWADHETFVADPAFLNTAQKDGLKKMTSKSYAQTLRDPNKIDLDHTKSVSVAGCTPGMHTNHFSVVDKDGNAVAVTTTVNLYFGSCVTVPDTGILLNDELQDFCEQGSINQPDSGKKPRSHQSPTIVVRGCRPALVTGGLGGGTIMMGVLQDILNIVDFDLDLDQAVDAKRIEARAYVPDPNDLFMDPNRFDPEVIAELGPPTTGHPNGRGHNVRPENPFGDFPVSCDGSVDTTLFGTVPGTHAHYEYMGAPILSTARFNFKTGKNEAVTDPRNGNVNPPDTTFGDNGAKGQSGVTGTTPLCAQPDLIVKEVKTIMNQAPQGEKVTITATVANIGSEQSAGPSKTEFRIDGSTVLGLVDTPAIPAGGTANVSVSHFRTAGMKASHTMTATADVANAVTESNEANNSATTTVVLKGNRVLP